MSKDISRLGQEAEYILSTEAYKIASEALEARVLEDWASGLFTTTEQREEAFNRVRAARVFRAGLTALIENMKVSKAQAEGKRKRRVAAGLPPEET